jgi:hypothetical protein
MKKATTENEKELLDCLYDVIGQACPGICDSKDDYDSMALSAYAQGLRLLAEYGMVKIVAEAGRRVIAREVPNGGIK